MQATGASEPKSRPAALEIMMLAQELQGKMEELSGRTERVLAPIMTPFDPEGESLTSKDLVLAYPPYFAELRSIFARINEWIECIHGYLLRVEME